MAVPDRLAKSIIFLVIQKPFSTIISEEQVEKSQRIVNRKKEKIYR
jgi:hypothetical protein